MGWRILGLALVIIGAVITFAGKTLVEHMCKKQLLQRHILIIKLAGAVIVVTGAVLVFQFGG